MENNLVDKIFITGEFGEPLTQDDFNNFLIDMWVAQRDYELNRELDKDVPISAVSGKTVTITLTKDNYWRDIEAE